MSEAKGLDYPFIYARALTDYASFRNMHISEFLMKTHTMKHVVENVAGSGDVSGTVSVGTSVGADYLKSDPSAKGPVKKVVPGYSEYVYLTRLEYTIMKLYDNEAVIVRSILEHCREIRRRAYCRYRSRELRGQIRAYITGYGYQYYTVVRTSSEEKDETDWSGCGRSGCSHCP